MRVAKKLFPMLYNEKPNWAPVKNTFIKSHLWRLVFPFIASVLEWKETLQFWCQKWHFANTCESQALAFAARIKISLSCSSLRCFSIWSSCSKNLSCARTSLACSYLSSSWKYSKYVSHYSLKNKAVNLYCTKEEHTHSKLQCSLCPFQTNSRSIFTPVKPARTPKSILFCSVNHQILTSKLISSRL